MNVRTGASQVGIVCSVRFSVLILFLGIIASASVAQTIALPRESDWRYEDSGTDLGSGWIDPGYADGGWSSGPGTLGYGDSFITTTISYGPDPDNKYPTAYFRTSFELADDPVDIFSLLLSIRFDDGAIVYLNGLEVARVNMPAGPVGWGTYASASHEGNGYERIDLSTHIGSLLPGTNRLAAEVHQRNASSSDLAWDAELVYSDSSAFILRGPYLQSGGETATTIRWRTNVPTESHVAFGTSPDQLTETTTVAGTRTEHEIRLTDLGPETRYYYGVGTSDTLIAGGDADHFFETHPVSGTVAPFRAWIVGDSGEANQAARDVRDAYLGYSRGNRADLFLMLGDNAYDTGTDAEYQAAVFEMYPEILRNTVLWPTRGNHDDLHSGQNNDYYEIFTMPTAGEAGGLPSGTEAYYSFDYAGTHFVCLDSNASDLSPGGAMVTWLTQDLAATDQNWIVAFWHHPPYTKGSHDSDDNGDSSGRMRAMRENVLPVLEAAGVDLVLSGHSHAYERSYFLAGHYGYSWELEPGMVLDQGDGSETGDGAYQKAARSPFDGAVYTVAGSSSKTGGGTLDHPVMVTSLNTLGSVVLEVDEETLHLVFIDDGGIVQDDFTIRHLTGASVEPGVTEEETPAVPGTDLELGSLSTASPATTVSTIRFRTRATAPARLSIHDAGGRAIRTLLDSELPAGSHEFRWDLETECGQMVSSGVYFAIVSVGNRSEAERIVVRK